MNLKRLMLGFAVLLLTACNNDKTAVVAFTEVPALPDGAYLLKDVEVTESGVVSILLRDQIKIYTNNRFMFAFMNKEIGIDVGAGIATWDDGVMVEVPTVNHNGSVEGYSFDVAIEETDSGFVQTIMGMKYDDGRSLDMVETWNTASIVTSPYDGLWHRVQDGIFTTKIIGGGHFISLQRTTSTEGPDLSNSSEFWFGSIEFGKNGQAVETGMTSSVQNYSDAQQSLHLVLIDQDNLSQTATVDGIEVTEIYQRL
ncbi:MAG: Uncharacterised protein [Porticoccaceae bacterium UBA1117]|nr:hypothetical protein [Porticoccaceae bacterium]CAI8359490.1 MAG: Uncharacterised protein [Porticoccaceae bacterium UBA1117]